METLLFAQGDNRAQYDKLLVWIPEGKTGRDACPTSNDKQRAVKKVKKGPLKIGACNLPGDCL